MATATQILANIDFTQVTPEQIGKCHKAFELVDGKAVPFYLVENEAGTLDQDGEIIEYKVTYDTKHGFRCTCKAGQHGFANCKNSACKHVGWAVAASREESEALAELALEDAQQDVKTSVLTKTEKAFYRGEEKRQQATASFFAGLPSRQ